MSVIAPAGRVKRNIGSVVATWTADTIIGSGLRLVMSQFDEVSNIANPTFDAELAISMTVNAKLPKTPQSRAAGASDLAVDSLDNKNPIGRARNWGRYDPPNIQIKWRTARRVSRRRSAKSDRNGRVRCSKSGPERIRSESVCAGNHLNRICPKECHALVGPALELGEARRHELDKFRERVAVLGAKFRQPFRE